MVHTKHEDRLLQIRDQALGLGLWVETDLWHTDGCDFVDASGVGHGWYRIHHITHVDVYCESPEEVNTVFDLFGRRDVENNIRTAHLYHSTKTGTIDIASFETWL